MTNRKADIEAFMKIAPAVVNTQPTKQALQDHRNSEEKRIRVQAEKRIYEDRCTRLLFVLGQRLTKKQLLELNDLLGDYNGKFSAMLYEHAETLQK